MHRKDFERILFGELNKIGPDIAKHLHKTVDVLQLWNGKFEVDAVRATDLSTITYRGHKSYHHDIVLSLGSLRISYEVDVNDHLGSMMFQYRMPEVNRWNQPLYRNRIERGTTDPSKFDNEISLARYIVKRYNDLIQAVHVWFKESSVNIKTFDYKAFKGGHDIDYPSYINFLMGAVGRARLCAEVHRQRMDALGVSSNADRISTLANQLMDEVRIHLSDQPIFSNVPFNETY